MDWREVHRPQRIEQIGEDDLQNQRQALSGGSHTSLNSIPAQVHPSEVFHDRNGRPIGGPVFESNHMQGDVGVGPRAEGSAPRRRKRGGSKQIKADAGHAPTQSPPLMDRPVRSFVGALRCLAHGKGGVFTAAQPCEYSVMR